MLLVSQQNWCVRIQAPSRLSFTLIDMNGETGRRNGMASASLREPFFQAILKPSQKFTFYFDDYSSVHEEYIVSYMKKLQGNWSGLPVEVCVEHGLPANSGFGSKTTTLIALGKAYAELCGKKVRTEELAKIAGRGGTSGASVNLIDRGGFLIDGGHANPIDFDKDPTKYLVPSRYAEVNQIPPIIMNVAFPPWPILIILCKGKNVQGQTELKFFENSIPIPAAEAHKTAHLVLMNLATAVAEADYESFCRAVNRITYNSYFKQRQIENQSDEVRFLIGEAGTRSDIDAFGMSSMGPMCYAFAPKSLSLLDWLENNKERGIVTDYWFTSIQNSPCLIEYCFNCDRSGKG